MRARRSFGLALGSVAIVLLLSGAGRTWAGTFLLSFNNPVPGAVLDRSGLGTGFTTRLPGTGSALPVDDPNLDLSSSPGRLLLTTTQSNFNQDGHSNLAQLEAPGVRLSHIGTRDFALSALVENIRVLNGSDQIWLYAGTSATDLVRAGFHYTNRYYIIGNQGSGDFAPFTGDPNAFETGDDVIISFGRSDGVWQLSWDNLTHPSESGSSPGVLLPWLDTADNLYVGISASNVWPNTATFTASFDYFSVTTAEPVPEPTSFTLLIVGVVSLLSRKWRRQGLRLYNEKRQ